MGMLAIIRIAGAFFLITFFTLCIPLFLLKSLWTALFSGRWNSFKNMTAVVTGAGNGLGRELALQLAVKNNCRVICVDMKKDDLMETIRIIDKATKPGQATAHVCDITDQAGITAMRDEVLNKFGKIDLLINNAAFLYVENITNCNDYLVKRCFDVNVLGTIWVTKAFLPSMKSEKKGQILFVNSIGGLTEVACMPFYCTSKAAISSFATSLQIQLNSEGYSAIHISSAHPWVISTNPAFDIVSKNNIGSMPTEYAASAVLEGTRRRQREFLVPGGPIASRLVLFGQRFLPDDFGNCMRKIFGFHVELSKVQTKMLDSLTSPDQSHKMTNQMIVDCNNKI